MIKTLTLKNFKRHRDLTVNFTEGLNVIRAANEAGKSTLYGAIAYAFWGSRALTDSLEETVTWGESTSSLKVTLVFTVGDVEFTISRSKSGAELVGPGVTASGQAEVTAFVERLFGASYQVGFATMIANQSSLQDGLDGSAISLIEKLSNMGVIDEYVLKIQESLPSGNTKALEQQIAGFADLKKPAADFYAAEFALKSAESAEQEGAKALEALQMAAQGLQRAAEAAKLRMSEQVARASEKAAAERQLVALNQQLAAPLPVKPATDVLELERLQKAQEQHKVSAAAWKTFQGPCGSHIFSFRGSFTELKESIKLHEGKIAEATAQRNSLVTEIAVTNSKLITQTSCGLCGKDLANVPEVVEVNEKLRAKMEALQQEKEDCEDRLDVLKLRHSQLVAAEKDYARIISAVAGIRQFVSVDAETVPPSVAWTAEPVTEIDPQDYADLIAKAKMQERAYTVAEASRAAAFEQQQKVQSRLKELEQIVELPEDRNTVLEAQRALQAAHDAALQQRDLVAKKQQAEAHLAAEKKQYAAELAAYENSVASKQQFTALLEATEFHNRIIKKLREARPIVAKELWGMVLTGVSQIFSDIRGVRSTVTRGTAGFLIDGKKVSSYSGSTKDSLGLANRIMLQKTFMGTLDFMLLDEPAAASDATRETDMLAAIVRADFRQVILVTHSERADTFAANVVTL